MDLELDGVSEGYGLCLRPHGAAPGKDGSQGAARVLGLAAASTSPARQTAAKRC